MVQAIIIHGTCSEEEYFDVSSPALCHKHWIPWLHKQLLIKGIHTQTPQMPLAYKPDYSQWKEMFEKVLDEDTKILVGHSCGGGFLTRWLSENHRSFDTVILIAPWLDPDRVKTTDFFEFQIDNKLSQRIKNLKLFISTDDDSDIIKSFNIITSEIADIDVVTFTDKGHFTEKTMKSTKFPELLSAIIN